MVVSEKKYTTEEAAKALGRTVTAVRALANEGKLGFYRIGRLMIFGESHLQKYLESTLIEAAK
jgi:excisionase family DNA binding protein